MQNNSAKISSLINKLNQQSINPVSENELGILNGQSIDNEDSQQQSQIFQNDDILKPKFSSNNKEQLRIIQSLTKYDFAKQINLQSRKKQNPSENIQANIVKIRESGSRIRLRESELNQRYSMPFSDLMKSYEDRKNIQKYIKTDNASSSVLKIQSNNRLKNTINNSIVHDSAFKNSILSKNSDQIIYNIDRGFGANIPKKLSLLHKKHFSLNDRVQSMPTDRTMFISSNQAYLSPPQQQFQILQTQDRKKFSTQHVKQISSLPNPYMLSQTSSVPDYKNSITKSSSSSQIMKNLINIASQANKFNTVPIKNSNENKEHLQEEDYYDNSNLFKLYREQQLEQDRKLRELSKKQRTSFTNLTNIQKLYDNSLIEQISCDKYKEYYKNNQKMVIDQNFKQLDISNKQDVKQSRKLSKEISQQQIKQKILKDENNSIIEESSGIAKYQSENRLLSDRQYGKDTKNYRCLSFQYLLASKTSNSIQYDQKQLIDFENSKDEDDDEELFQLNPNFQQNLKKKTTQDSIMQTTFSETIPELIANQFKSFPKYQEQNLYQKKTERNISNYPINKNFISNTFDSHDQQEEDQMLNKKIENQLNTRANDEILYQKNQLLMNKYQDIIDNKSQEIKIQNNIDTENIGSKYKQIQLAITVYTSKEEFLQQLNKKIQKTLQNNFDNKQNQQEKSFQENTQQIHLNNIFQFEDTQVNTQTIRYSVGKNIVFHVQSDDVIKKIKESNNPQLYELLKTLKLNGSLQVINNDFGHIMKENEKISIGQQLDQTIKVSQKYNNNKQRIICKLFLKKVNCKPNYQYSINNIQPYKQMMHLQSNLNK